MRSTTRGAGRRVASGIALLTLVLLPGCGASDPPTTTAATVAAADTPTTNADSTSTTVTTAASTTTSTAAPTPAMSAIPGAEGSVYLVTRDDELVEIVLGTGTLRRSPFPTEGGVSPDTIAVLADGVVAFRRNDFGLVAFPRGRADSPVVAGDLRVVSRAGAAVVAVPRAADTPEGASELAVVDGRGQVTATAPLRAGVTVFFAGGAERFALVGDELVSPSLEALSLGSGEIDRIASGQTLLATNGKVLLTRSATCDDACTLSTLTVDGETIASMPMPRMGNRNPITAALVTADGTRVVYGWVGKVTEPGEIRVLELATGASTTLLQADGFPTPAALTSDGRFVVTPTNLPAGEVAVSPIDGGPPTTYRLDESVTAVAAGPSR